MEEAQGPETPATGFKGKGIGLSGTEIAFAPKNWEELWNFAQLIAKTDFVPKAFNQNAGAVLAAIQTGHEIGLPPMASLQSIAVINGRPSVWGDGALAILAHSREFEWIRELPPDQCEEQEMGECIVKMRGQEPVSRRFTKAMAERAKLLTKEGPWQTYRGRMYQMRARGWAMRDAAPGVFRGVTIREEQEDIEVEAERPPVEPPIRLPQPKETKADEKQHSDRDRDSDNRGSDRQAGEAAGRGLKNDPLWKEIGAEILLERHVKAAAQPKKRRARKTSPSIPTT